MQKHQGEKALGAFAVGQREEVYILKKGYLYIIFATILFSTMEVALKSVSGEFHPVQMNLSRFLVGGIVLLPLALTSLKKKNLTLGKNDFKYFAFLGFVCVIVSMMFYQLAVMNTEASVVAVLFSGNPVFVMIFAYIILKEQIYKRNIVALVLEVIGIIIIINPFNTQLNPIGVILTLLATVTFSLYSVFGKKKSIAFGGLVVTCFSFLFGSLEMLLLTLLTKIGVVSDWLTVNGMGLFADIPLLTGYTAGNILVVLYIYIFVTGGGYTFYFKAMEETSSSVASLVFFFKPVLAPILALVLLGETIPMNMVVGILVILAGSMVSLLPDIMDYKKRLQ